MGSLHAAGHLLDLRYSALLVLYGEEGEVKEKKKRKRKRKEKKKGGVRRGRGMRKKKRDKKGKWKEKVFMVYKNKRAEK